MFLLPLAAPSYNYSSYCGLVKIVYLRLYAFILLVSLDRFQFLYFFSNVCKFVSCRESVLSVDSRNSKNGLRVFSFYFPRNTAMCVNNSQKDFKLSKWSMSGL